MIATGIDLVTISRINDIVTKNPRFLTRFFGNEEQTLFNSKKGNAKIQSIAGNFAAKEAFSKALGSGISGFSLNEVQILRNHLGAPYIELSGSALILFNALNAEISVSISHTDEYATAIVILISV